MRALNIPAGVVEAAALTNTFDACLGGGLARLGPDQVAGLGDLAAAFAGTPLGAPVASAIQGLAAGELLAHHLATLAAARASLEGARAEALLGEAADALGLTVEAPQTSAPPSPADPTRVRMESARQWLVELALAGLEQLDGASIVPVMAALEGLQERPELQGLASVMTGFAMELLDAAPTSALADPPRRRWADLWTRCMLATATLPAPATTRKVDGRWSPLGADIRHHDNLISIVIHGLLEEGSARRLVRTTVSAWKVDAIIEAEIWGLLQPLAPEAIDGLAKPKTLAISGATLSSSGDLAWDGKVGAGSAFDPFAADLSGAILAAPLPMDLHPIQIGVPRVLSSCKVTSRAVDGLALVLDRVSPHSDLEPEEVDSSEAMVGLLRFDDRWALQPLAARKGKTVFGPAQGIAAAAKISKPALSILKERASKLLRAS